MEYLQAELSKLGIDLEKWFENYDFSEGDLKRADSKIMELVQRGFQVKVQPDNSTPWVNFKIILTRDRARATLTPMPTGCVLLRAEYQVKFEQGTTTFEVEDPYPGFEKAFQALENILQQVGAL